MSECDNNFSAEVSVIIPAYNSAKYIAETIESVIHQTFVNWEVVVVDDCSNDETEEVVNTYVRQDSRIRYYMLQNNSGRPAVPRNVGIKKSNGKYIAFLDADDLWDKKKLECQMSYFKSHCDVALVFSNYVMFDDECRCEKLSQREAQILSNSCQYFKYLCLDNVIGNSTVVIKREMVVRYGYLDEDEELCGSEDYEYWLRLSVCEMFGFIDDVLMYYRVVDNSVSKRTMVMAKGTALAFEKVVKRYPTLQRQLIRQGRAKCLSKIGSAELLYGQWRNGMGSLLKSIFINPRDLWTWLWFCLGVCGQRISIYLHRICLNKKTASWAPIRRHL